MEKYNKYSILIAFLCLSFCLIGCNPQGKEIDNTKARLDLARQNNNLNQMYLSLTQLKNLGKKSKEIENELSKVESGIEILNNLTLYKSSHDHENAVKSAAQLLALFPYHPEANKTLNESGLILSYLESTKENINSCFKKSVENKFELIPPERMNGYNIKVNYRKILFNLGKAEKSLKEAKKLDPRVEQILEFEKIIRELKKNLILNLTNNILKRSIAVTDYMNSFYNIIYSGMSDEEDKNWASSDFLKKAAPYIREVNKTVVPIINEMNILSSYLSNYSKEGETTFLKFVNQLNMKTSKYVSSITNPQSSIMDYKKKNDYQSRDIKSLITKINASLPESSKISKNIETFGATISHYRLFNSPKDTENILEKYKIVI